MRTVCILVTVIIYNTEILTPLPSAGVMFILNALTYIICLYFPTFYSKIATKFMLFNSFMVFWFSAWLFLTLLTGNILRGSFVSFLFCVPVIYLIFQYKNRLDDLGVVLKPFEEIVSASELIEKLEGIRYYFSTRQIVESSESAVEKILSSSQELFTLEEQFNLFVAMKAYKSETYDAVEKQAMNNLINILYEKGLKKFNNHPELILSHACYLIELDKKENLALEKAIYLESTVQDFSTLYVVQSLKDFITGAQKQDGDMSADTLRFEQIMNRRLEDKLHGLLVKAAQSVGDLYNLLEEEGLSIRRLEVQLERVAKAKIKVENFWKTHNSAFIQNSEAKDKIIYLFKYIYDKEKVGDLSVADQIEKKHNAKYDRLKNFNIDHGASTQSDPTLIVRLLENDCVIEDMNLAVLRLVGYLRKDLIGASLLTIMIKEQFEIFWKMYKKNSESLTRSNFDPKNKIFI